MSAQQLALDLPHLTARGRGDFLVAPCNREAISWLDRWPDWPASALAIHGPAGCGKSHLAAVWKAKSGAGEIALGNLAAADTAALLGERRHWILDAGDGAPPADKAAEEVLLHFYNYAIERGGQLLLISRQAPARWPTDLADLRSRLSALPAVAIGRPDDALLGAVLVKLFADRQVKVDRRVVTYMLARLERSFEAARRAVESVDIESLAEGRPITFRFAGEVLRRHEGAEDQPS